MGLLLNIYHAKIKIVLGALKASRTNILLILVYLLGVISGCFGLGLALTEAIQKGAILYAYVDELSALISLGLAITILTSF